MRTRRELRLTMYTAMFVSKSRELKQGVKSNLTKIEAHDSGGRLVGYRLASLGVQLGPLDAKLNMVQNEAIRYTTQYGS
jgi:hypothetical protein